jgi:YfiH family protein
MTLDFETSQSLNQISKIEHKFYTKNAVVTQEVIIPKICHGSDVLYLTDKSDENISKPADAIVTTNKGLVLGVTYADCLPILLSSSDGECIAAIHAGWRGILSGVIINTVNYIKIHLQVRAQIIAAIGPCISQEGFIVQKTLRDLFLLNYKNFIKEVNNNYHIDLYGIAKSQLTYLGITNIEKVGGFTDIDSSRYYSHRRNQDQKRHIAIINKKF